MVPYLYMLGAAQTLASTIVSATRIDEEKGEFAKTLSKVEDGKGKVSDSKGKIEGEAMAVYDRGKGKSVQPLSKVATDPDTVAALEKAGQLVQPDTTIDTLMRNSASTQLSTPDSKASIADVTKALQAGGERLKQSLRVGSNLHLQA